MSWKPLRVSSLDIPGLPPMLIAVELTPSSYTIHLTDLVSIWSETLSRSQIIQRSLEEKASIDPSSSDQLSILISKLELGLTGAPGTTLDLTVVDADTMSHAPPLNLHVHVELPGGMTALEWPVRLSAMPTSLLTNQLTLPLLRSQYHTSEKLNALIQTVQEKDHVIEKLLEKLEEQGTDLGHIFPRAAGKQGKKLNRKIAEQKVKGLAQFEFESWKKSHEVSHDSDNITSLLDKIFGNKAAQMFDLKIGVSPGSETWWKRMKGGFTISLGAGEVPSKSVPQVKRPKMEKKASRNAPFDSDDDDDDAFEVAAASKRERRGASKVLPDEEYDNNGQKTTNYSYLSRQKEPSTFFEERKASAASEPKVEDAHEPEKSLGETKAKTLSLDTSRPGDDHNTPVLSAPASALENRPQSKLGVLKGKKPNLRPPPPKCTSTESPSNIANESPKAPFQAPARKKPKLGTIRGKKVSTAVITTTPAVSATPSCSTPPCAQIELVSSIQAPEPSVTKHENIKTKNKIPVETKQETPPEASIDPKETEIERANRNRAELRREIDARKQAQAAQKKKKRCF
ncbi:hypothetical protein K3495_g5629 [Podosphaera aphanis]|nr:hypothetical protein K3495_g5629 [Podosphaera aphanis]